MQNEMATVGPICMINALKSIPAADPIMILGGSSIKVAARPTLDASTIAITKGMGDSIIDLNTEIVTGTIKRTVVTLCMNIDIVPVKTQSNIMSFQRFPFEAFIALMPTN
jgi:hypothetical protein